MSEELHLSHAARVYLNQTEQRNQELLESLISQGVLDARTADKYPPFFFRAEISNDLLDSHFTHMNEKTLTNYAEDANRGVAFLKGHNWKDIPVGYSIEASLQTEGQRKLVLANFYTITGLPETEDLVARIRSGLVRDVSVGFGGGQMVCDICQRDFWECSHWPGLKYEEKKGDVVTQVLATYTIDDARLSEVSAVFDGSTPNAMIRKAEIAARDGNLTREQVALLEQRYRIHLPIRSSYPVAEAPKQESKEEGMDFYTSLVGKMVELRVISQEDYPNLTEETVLQKAVGAFQRLHQIEPLVEDAQAYREEMVSDALAQGIRAMGEQFNKEAYEPVLRGLPIPTIRQMRDDWKKIGDKNFPTGRQSQDEGEKAVKVPAHPPSAYKS